MRGSRRTSARDNWQVSGDRHDREVATNERLRSRGTRRANRLRLDLGTELVHARLAAGMSQREAGAAAGLSEDKVWKIENDRAPALSFRDAARLGAVLGLDLSARFYPTGVRIRDAAQARQLSSFLGHVGGGLRFKTDVPLPQIPDQSPELRAWDSIIWDAVARTAVEFEARIQDVQAMTRRHAMKRRDDPVDNFLLVTADTVHNRRVLAEFGALLPDLPRLRTATVLAALEAGRHPPTGYILFKGPPIPRSITAPDAGLNEVSATPAAAELALTLNAAPSAANAPDSGNSGQ